MPVGNREILRLCIVALPNHGHGESCPLDLLIGIASRRIHVISEHSLIETTCVASILVVFLVVVTARLIS